MTVVNCLDCEDQELSLSEIARRTGMAKPTVFRLVNELTTWGVLERTGSGVRLGLRLFQLGQLAPRQMRLRDAAAPFLATLCHDTQQTVHLAILDGLDVVYVDKLNGQDGPTLPSRTGGRMPLHCTGVGKALLAYSPQATLTAIVEAGLSRRTPRTIVAPGMLVRELATVREHGLAYEREESAVGVACVAMPIVCPTGAVAAISVSGRAHVVNTPRVNAALRRASAGIVRELALPVA